MTQHSTPSGSDPTQYYTITASKVWQQIDFYDTTSERVTIQLAGGKCNRTLGLGHFDITFRECSTWKRSVTLNEGNTKHFNVPAQQMNVELIKVMRGVNQLP